METGVRKTLDGYQAWFKIDNQTFHLEECVEDTDEDSLEAAQFFEKMLKVAFAKLNIPDVVGRSEQLKAFLDFVDIRYKNSGTRDKIVDEFLSL